MAQEAVKVRLGILHSVLRPEEKMLAKEVERRRDVELLMLDSRRLIMAPGSRPEALGAVDVLLDREVSRSRALATLRVLGGAGVVCVNRYQVARTSSDKVLTTKALADEGVPTPGVRIAFTPAGALEAIEQLGYPVVIKPVDGSWGRLMAKLNDREAAEAVLEHKARLCSMVHSIFYLQEYVEKPGRDIRAFVVGDETICASYRVSEHWLTNAARGARARPCPVTTELGELCVKAARAVGGGALAVDLMETEDGYVVHELNSAMEFKGSLQAVDVDIPAALIDYCLAQAWERAPGQREVGAHV